MSVNYFGSDGIRGPFGTHPITSSFMQMLGFAVGKARRRHPDKPPRCFIAGDGRASGHAIEAALVAGLGKVGAHIALAGILPTPAVAFHMAQGDFDVGICITASHNAADHNGVKLFNQNGHKLTDADQDQIVQQCVERGAPENEASAPVNAQVAQADAPQMLQMADAAERYVDFCINSLPSGVDLSGLHLVLDTANGAASAIAPKIFTALGVKITAIGASSNGENINQNCGALYPETLIAKIREVRADCGVALDGDGDRLILADQNGALLDGDDLLFMIATHLQQKNALQGGVVGTETTNSGLARAFAAQGIPFERAQVGERHVLERMQAKGWKLGGEQSGHLVLLDQLPSSDGILTAIQLLSAWQASGLTLAELSAGWQRVTTATLNVAPVPVVDAEAARAAIADIEQALGPNGRILVRPSGTEDRIRILVEAESHTQAEQKATQLAEVIRRFGFAP